MLFSREWPYPPTLDTAADCSRSRQVAFHEHGESGVLKGVGVEDGLSRVAQLS